MEWKKTTPNEWTRCAQCNRSVSSSCVKNRCDNRPIKKNESEKWNNYLARRTRQMAGRAGTTCAQQWTKWYERVHSQRIVSQLKEALRKCIKLSAKHRFREFVLDVGCIAFVVSCISNSSVMAQHNNSFSEIEDLQRETSYFWKKKKQACIGIGIWHTWTQIRSVPTTSR